MRIQIMDTENSLIDTTNPDITFPGTVINYAGDGKIDIEGGRLRYMNPQGSGVYPLDEIDLTNLNFRCGDAGELTVAYDVREASLQVNYTGEKAVTLYNNRAMTLLIHNEGAGSILLHNNGAGKVVVRNTGMGKVRAFNTGEGTLYASFEEGDYYSMDTSLIVTNPLDGKVSIGRRGSGPTGILVAGINVPIL